MISILEKLIGEYQKELLIIIREIKTHILYNMHKIRNTHAWVNDFTILNSNYRSKIKRKISESSYIRSKKPTLNTK